MTFRPRKALRELSDWAARRRRRAREHSGLVLMYHRVARVSVDPWDLCVWPERFECQMRVLREIADVAPVKDIHAQVRTGRRERPIVAVTFDDGYADNLHAAKPVLEANRIPATVFLATGSLGESLPYWWDALATAILDVERLPTHLILESETSRFECRDPAISWSGNKGRRARRALHDRLWGWLGAQPPADRAVLIERIQSWAGQTSARVDAARPMTRAEVRELVAGGLVEVGGHTHSHPMLSRLTPESKREEISASWRACTDIVGVSPTTFAYPHGDFDEECVELVRQTGFALACTSQPALVWPDTDPLTTPRVAVGNWDEPAFFRKLKWWLA